MGMVLGAGSCSGLENPRQGVRKEHLQVARPGLCLKQGFVSARFCPAESRRGLRRQGLPVGSSCSPGHVKRSQFCVKLFAGRDAED